MNRLALLLKCLRVFIIAVGFWSACAANCAGAGDCRKGKDICGKIVDFDTGRPIEGVVVAVAWFEPVFRLVIEPGAKYYDSEETLTDKNGEFAIKGRTSHLFLKLEPPKVAIFKTEYSILHLQDLGMLLRRSLPPELRVEWEGDRPTIHYRKKTLEKRKQYLKSRPRRPHYGVPASKCKLFRAEVDRALVAAGMYPPGPAGQGQFRVLKGGEYPAAAKAVNPTPAGRTPGAHAAAAGKTAD
jgi:hypothetical protein